MNRQERRAAMRAEKAKAESLNLQSGGYGLGNPNAVPASGQRPDVNPFMQPKSTGLGITTQTFLNNYYVNWTPETWRQVCDQAMKQGWLIGYATLVSWCFESSAFIRGLFLDLYDMASDADIYLSDAKGNKLDDWTTEICKKEWFIKQNKEIVAADGWGISVLNIDPIGNKVYKYPMQNIDPINQMLRASTFDFDNGMKISDYANLIYIQPSTNYESFLGWMQPVARDYIQMNVNSNTWLAAGKRLAFPLMMVGYPQSGAIQDENGNVINVDKIAAENIIKNADPTNGVAFPYTRKPDGTIEKAIEVEFAGAQGSKGNAHSIFSDFNKEKKDEIREMIFGENMTSNAGEKGSRALGEVHERKHFRREKTKVNELLSYLNNDEYINKLSKFYKNFPKGAKFVCNVQKEWQIDEVKAVSDAANANGKKLSDKFFLKLGLSEEDFEDRPEPVIQPIQESKDNEPVNPKELKKKFISILNTRS